jgi:vacuolar-type H+-ATPase catalytic subunit A/Vma1
MKMPIAKGAEFMTDFQFRSIIKMVLAIAESKSDVKDVIRELKKLLEEKPDDE